MAFFARRTLDVFDVLDVDGVRVGARCWEAVAVGSKTPLEFCQQDVQGHKAFPLMGGGGVQCRFHQLWRFSLGPDMEEARGDGMKG